MGRRLLHTNQEHLKRGAWTAEEDRILANYINTHGETGWKSLPNKAGLNRCGKSCRLRWLNYLRPDIKRGNISADEDELIIRLHRLLGNRWALIAGRLPGRTDNEIKNYWNTHLSKKLAMGSSRAVDSTAHEPLGKDATVPGMEKQSEFNEDDGSKRCEVRCGSDNDEQVLNDTKSWTQLLEESIMDNPAEDTQVDDSNVSSKFNVSYPLHHCNLFALSCNDFRSREDFSGQAGDIWLLHNNPNAPSHTFGDAKCLGIAEKYNSLEGEETRLIELLPFEWEGHVDFTASYQVEYLDNLVDIPDQDLTY